VIVLITKVKQRPSMAALFTKNPVENTVVEKKAFPLRISAPVLDAMQRWSNDELRSLNAQIEYVLREALHDAGRLKPAQKPKAIEGDSA
jgi:hypothetical protein